MKNQIKRRNSVLYKLAIITLKPNILNFLDQDILLSVYSDLNNDGIATTSLRTIACDVDYPRHDVSVPVTPSDEIIKGLDRLSNLGLISYEKKQNGIVIVKPNQDALVNLCVNEIGLIPTFPFNK